MSPSLVLVDGDSRLADVISLDLYRKARSSVSDIPRPRNTDGDEAA
jgi:hypothetical protein